MSIFGDHRGNFDAESISGSQFGSNEDLDSIESFDLKDDDIDDNSFHAGYAEDEIIAEASALGSTKDNLKHFSKDMRSDHYKIRDPEVQRKWGEKKTEMQKRATKVLLLTNYSLWALYDECTRLVKQTGEPRLFTVIDRDDEGKVTLSY